MVNAYGMNLKQMISLILLILIDSAYSQSIRFLQEPSDVIALPGNKVLLQCVIIDDQSNLLDAQWYRNGVIIEGLQRHQNFRTGNNLTIGLNIFNIMEADSGAMYHCTPNGQPQISSRRVSIIVASVPEFQQNEAIILVVNTTVSSISIQWQPAITSISTYIVPIIKYIISLYNDTELQNTFEIFTNVTVLNYTFTELEASM